MTGLADISNAAAGTDSADGSEKKITQKNISLMKACGPADVHVSKLSRFKALLIKEAALKAADTEKEERKERASACKDKFPEEIKRIGSSVSEQRKKRKVLRCCVCEMPWSTLRLQDGYTVPHRKILQKSEAGRGYLMFCPFADDHKILSDFLEAKSTKGKKRKCEGGVDM